VDSETAMSLLTGNRRNGKKAVSRGKLNCQKSSPRFSVFSSFGFSKWKNNQEKSGVRNDLENICDCAFLPRK